MQITTDDGRLVYTHCEVAERTIPRMRGLLGRSGLDPGEGMLINAAPSVMTFITMTVATARATAQVRSR